MTAGAESAVRRKGWGILSGCNWQHFSHGADIGVGGCGPTRDAAFEQAAIALVSVICDISDVAAGQRVDVQCSAPNDDFLFVEWLNALIYEMATRGMLFGRFIVRIEGHDLNATAWGEPVDLVRHSPAVEVKGATLTELRVAQDSDGQWTAQCIVDV